MEPSASDFFEALERSARNAPESATQADTVFKFVLSGTHGGAWLVDLTKGKRSGFVARLPDATSEPASHPEEAPEPAATIHVDASDWVAMTTGKMNPMRAFMSGKIKVDGDIKLAVNLPIVVNMVDGYGIGTQGPITVMRTAIENLDIRWQDQPVPITCSFGVSQVRAADESIDACLARADQALYEAKSGGRNRVCRR